MLYLLIICTSALIKIKLELISSDHKLLNNSTVKLENYKNVFINSLNTEEVSGWELQPQNSK
jgi:hypothetical protein